MKTTQISKLPIKPEEYGTDGYNQIDWSIVDSEMTDGQRRFINGLVQYYEPAHVLELGVSAGGGTICLLNALQHTKNRGGGGKLYSVDSASEFYRNPELSVGFLAVEKYADLLDKEWHLVTGKDPASVMETINKKFDFCVIDTLHHHPVEVLNFISILPWLNDGAVVVMHDTTVFEWRTKATFLRMLAPRLLLSTVCAEKYIPNLPSGNMAVSNIAAWQVTADTRKYCRNLFDILYLPWEVHVPAATIQSIRELVKKYYPKELLDCFEEAVKINRSMLLAQQLGVLEFEQAYHHLKESTVFYGAGFKMRELLQSLDSNNIQFDFQIWDKNADRIKQIGKHTVTRPDFEKPAKVGQVMIVTIENKQIFDEICGQFEPLGYQIFHGIKQYLLSI